MITLAPTTNGTYIGTAAAIAETAHTVQKGHIPLNDSASFQTFMENTTWPCPQFELSYPTPNFATKPHIL